MFTGRHESTGRGRLTELDPARMRVFAVGIVEYRDPDLASWSQVGREDVALVETLRARGVPDERIVFLRDREATLAGIRNAFGDMLRRTREDDVLFFYFGGHGGKAPDGSGYFLPHDAGARNSGSWWPNREVVARIDRGFGGRHAILTADSCHSGTLARVLKGGTLLRKSYTVVASAQSDESSTGSWIFARCLRQAFAGESAVDLDSDGRVTLAELGRYLAAEMVSSDQRQHPTLVTLGHQSADRLALTSRPGSRPARSRPGSRPGSRPAISELSVEVECGGAWHPALALRSEGGLHLVHYGDDLWDEWVEHDRVRVLEPEHAVPLLPEAATPYMAGVPVTEEEEIRAPGSLMAPRTTGAAMGFLVGRAGGGMTDGGIAGGGTDAPLQSSTEPEAGLPAPGEVEVPGGLVKVPGGLVKVPGDLVKIPGDLVTPRTTGAAMDSMGGMGMGASLRPPTRPGSGYEPDEPDDEPDPDR